tara:strand:- start:422 stop:1366 length:945 start_codon:yes stop_codon:yes gene_type:complete
MEKVQALIFKELVLRGFSLEGNTRVWNVADSKLWYLNPEQAQAYLDLEEDPSYLKDVVEKEIGLIKNNVEEICEKVDGGSINIIDLGCGDGKKASFYVEEMKKKGIKIRYCPIDISPYMVEKSLETMKNLDKEEIVESKWNISDFENLENVTYLLKKGDFDKNLFLLLGNTLGNFEINELLYEVGGSMKEGDYLLIGNGLDSRNEEDILRSYNTPQVDRFLSHILTLIGFDKEDMELGARFRNSRVEVYYTLNSEKELEYFGKKLQFCKGDQIIVAVSYKYNKDSFKDFLDMYFDPVDLYVADDDSHCLALCKK